MSLYGLSCTLSLVETFYPPDAAFRKEKFRIGCPPDAQRKKLYSSYSQMIDKASNSYLYLENGSIAGAVSCYENEIDDLFVDKAFQRQGLGRKLLLWGISHIKQQGYNEIILHVAKWNQNAIKLYLETGFTIQKEERVR